MSPDAIRLHAAYLAAQAELPGLRESLREAKRIVRERERAYYEAQERVSGIRIELEMELGFPAEPSDD